ncbi:NAD(P)-dependent oxidoreductase [Bacteriovoracaceae bacterium]|nr:NAD(P)-dependent oxidoreductase [Bacteriovoracaceae bacterium]
MFSAFSDDLSNILERGHGDFVRLRGAHLLITGGTGLFGKWLLQSLLWANELLALNLKLTVLSRNSEEFLTKNPEYRGEGIIEWITGDIRSFSLQNGRAIDFVIHGATAASKDQNDKNPQLMFDTIVSGADHLCKIIDGVESVLLYSSGAVYGPRFEAVSETSLCSTNPLDPKNAYAVGKLCSEHQTFLALREKNISLKIARCFAFLGPHLSLDIHFAIGNFIKDCLDGKDITLLGDGTPHRSYMYMGDLVLWSLAILIRGKKDNAYNVGSDEGLPLSEIAERVRSIYAEEDRSYNGRVVIHRQKREGKTSIYVPCIHKAKSELNIRVWTSLEDAIRRTIKWNRTGK